MTTEQWEHENQDTLMEYSIDGDPSVRRIQCEHCRKIIYNSDPKPQILQLPDLRPQDAELTQKHPKAY